MKKKKINFILLILMMFMIIGKTYSVHAESYSIKLDGVDYTCDGKSRTSGKGYPKSRYPSREQAKIECENNQVNYIDARGYIYIFDNPSTCKFVETAELYDCNCYATVYKGCKKVNSSQTPTYSQQHTIETKFMTESNTVFNEKSCKVTDSSQICQITLPEYKCANNKIFNGWISIQNGICDNATASGTSIYLKSNGQIHTYWTYYPCCGTTGKTNNTTQNATPKANSYTTPSTPNTQENNPIDFEDYVTNNNTNQIDNTNQINNTNQVDKNSNNEESNKSNDLLIIFIIIIAILIVIIILLLAKLRKKNSNNNRNNNNNNDRFYSNNYY